MSTPTYAESSTPTPDVDLPKQADARSGAKPQGKRPSVSQTNPKGQSGNVERANPKGQSGNNERANPKGQSNSKKSARSGKASRLLDEHRASSLAARRIEELMLSDNDEHDSLLRIALDREATSEASLLKRGISVPDVPGSRKRRIDDDNDEESVKNGSKQKRHQPPVEDSDSEWDPIRKMGMARVYCKEFALFNESQVSAVTTPQGQQDFIASMEKHRVRAKDTRRRNRQPKP